MCKVQHTTDGLASGHKVRAFGHLSNDYCCSSGRKWRGCQRSLVLAMLLICTSTALPCNTVMAPYLDTG